MKGSGLGKLAFNCSLVLHGGCYIESISFEELEEKVNKNSLTRNYAFSFYSLVANL